MASGHHCHFALRIWSPFTLSFTHNDTIFCHHFLLLVVASHLDAPEHADVAPDGGVGVVGDVAVRGAADLLGEAAAGGEVEEGAAGGVADHVVAVLVSAVKRSIGEVVQSRRRPLVGPSPG